REAGPAAPGQGRHEPAANTARGTETAMKTYLIEKYGDQPAGRAAELPDPQPGPEDVLVEIRAASVNPLDFKIRDGAFKRILPYRLPLVLGNDLAGVVVRVGSSVTRFAVGDEVYARPDKDRIGTFAE